jgi:ribosomal protein L17
MRHNKKNNHLGRTKAHREAMLSNMASSLIMHKRIFTTTAKAKALRKYIEPLITKSKSLEKTGEEAMHNRRVVFSMLQDKYAVTELFSKVSEKVGDRPGGYTRIIKTGNRLGDNAAMCFIELVDFNENMLKETKKVATKTRRSRRKSSGTATDIVSSPKATKTKNEELKEEVPFVEEQEVEVSIVEEPEATIETAEQPTTIDNTTPEEE